jgi:hypothetical protein
MAEVCKAPFGHPQEVVELAQRRQLYAGRRGFAPPVRHRLPARAGVRSAIALVAQGFERAVAGVDHRPSACVLGLLGPPHVGEAVRHLACEPPHGDERADDLGGVASAERDVRLGVHG